MQKKISSAAAIVRGRTWTSERTATVALFAVALFLGVNALTSMKAAFRLTEIREGIARTHETIEELQNLGGLIKDADLQARGYLLTGEPYFLEPHRQAVQQVEKQWAVLCMLTVQDAEQRKRLPGLRDLIRAKLGQIDEIIALQKNGGRQLAMAQMPGGVARLSMDEIRRVVIAMTQAERRLLGERERRAVRATRISIATFALVNLSALAMLGLAYGLTVAYLRRRRRTDLELRAAYGELEARVQERTVELELANRSLSAEVEQRRRAEADLAREHSILVADMALRRKMEEERETMLRKMMAALAEVKTLSGLLPICAGCKSIRDDKGYWRRLEAYISEHSSAEFSHGLCPKCAGELYPGVYSAKAAPGPAKPGGHGA